MQMSDRYQTDVSWKRNVFKNGNGQNFRTLIDNGLIIDNTGILVWFFKIKWYYNLDFDSNSLPYFKVFLYADICTC